MFNSLWPHGLKPPGFPAHHQCSEFAQTRPSSWWCHTTISSSVVPFSSWLQTFPASESSNNLFFATGCQTIGCVYLKYCLVYRCPIVLGPCVVKTILSPLNSLCSYVSEQLTILVWVLFGLFILFHWVIHVFFCQCYTALITIALWGVVKLGDVSSHCFPNVVGHPSTELTNLFFSFNVVLAI